MSETLRFPDAVPTLADGAVELRELTEADVPAWFARATDAESADLAGDPVPESIAEGARWLERHRERFRQRAAIRWSVAPAGTGESAGTVGLIITSAEERVAELGIVIGRPWWGRGLGTAAARLAAAYGFAALGLAEIQAEVLVRNRASRRMLEKVGFRLLRELPAGTQPGGDPEDCLLLTLAPPGGGEAG